MAQGPGHVPANECASRLPGQPVCDKAEQSPKCPAGSRPHSRPGVLALGLLTPGLCPAPVLGRPVEGTIHPGHP